GVEASVIESPISDLKLDAIGVSREKMLERIASAMRFADEHGIHAAFFGVDSTRAEPDFYRQVYETAVEAGAKEVAVVDTLGIASWKALTGETLFRRESGAVASQFHDPPSIEPYSSELVAAERAIVLGKKSGLDSIRIKVEELGLDVPEERWPELLAGVKELG